MVDGDGPQIFDHLMHLEKDIDPLMPGGNKKVTYT